MAVLVDLDSVAIRHGDRTLFEELSLTVTDGERIGVVGINGTGKSTLLRVIAGVEQPDEGQVRRGRGVRIGYLEQEPVLQGGTVRAAAGEGWEAAAALQRLGMAAAGDAEVSTLSGGEAKRVALARQLAHPVELMVLDEPTNHLDLPAVAWLEQQLLEFRGGLVLVSHDRHLLDRVTTRMLELDRGRGYVHEGGYSGYLAARVEREEQAASAESTRRNLARRELAWLRRGAPARTRKPRARIDAALQIVNGRPQEAARAGDLDLSISAPRLGDKVIEAIGVSYRHASAGRAETSLDAPPVLRGVDLDLAPDERLGIVGVNGSGKSTLLDLLARRRTPTSGTIEVGPTVVTGYYDQRGADLPPDVRVRDLVAGPTGVPGSPADVALMERFWFGGELQFARPATLSGGERRRLQLLLVLAGRPNVLFLDEPTNDLDLDTLRILEDFLEDWPGALVVVSHDRTFLERTTDRLASVQDGTLRPVAGGVAGWLRQLDEPASAPPRSRAPARTRSAEAQPKGPSASTIGRRLHEAEREMERLHRRRDRLHEALVAAGSDHVKLAELGRELSAVEAELRASEDRWLELAEAQS